MENFSTILRTVWRPAQKNSWGVASTPLTGRGLTLAETFQRLTENIAIPDKRTLYQIRAHPMASQLHCNIFENLKTFFAEYLKMCASAKTRFLAGVHI